MKLMPRDKPSEIGPIPEDWSLESVGSIASFTSGKGISVSALHRRSADYSVPVFGGNGIAGYTKTPLVREPTVVIGRVGQKCGEVYLTDGPAWISDNALFPRRVHREFDAAFFGMALKAAGLNNVRNRNDLPLVTQSILHAVKVAWPPTTAEQRAIATMLSDVDALIGALDKLIAKKRDLKQAAMQQLLTGLIRLPGFSGDWAVKTLGDLGTTYGGLIGKSKADFGEGAARYITFMNVMTNVVIDCNSFEQVDVHDCESQNRALKGDLFFNGSSETPDELGMCAVLREDVQDVFLNSFCFGFRLKNGAAADGLYLAYFFRSGQGRELLKALAQGAIRYNLSKKALLKLSFHCPSVEEQTAIATVLSEMDAELAALEARRDKIRAIKQGMMQELLTGRIRLV